MAPENGTTHDVETGLVIENSNAISPRLQLSTDNHPIKPGNRNVQP